VAAAILASVIADIPTVSVYVAQRLRDALREWLPALHLAVRLPHLQLGRPLGMGHGAFDD
jgi:hypothetical protein